MCVLLWSCREVEKVEVPVEPEKPEVVVVKEEMVTPLTNEQLNELRTQSMDLYKKVEELRRWRGIVKGQQDRIEGYPATIAMVAELEESLAEMKPP